jgi:hypothetical protein
MDILTLKTTDSILDSVVSAFTANGYTSQKTTVKKETKSGASYYFSLKKEKRVLRFNIYHSVSDDSMWLSINQDTKTLVEKYFTVDMTRKEIVLDIKGVENRIAELAAAYAEIVEGRKLQAFKLQLVIPYIQGKLDELGFHYVSHKIVGTKHVNVVFKLKESDPKRFDLVSVGETYEKLNKLESFEDWPFCIYFQPSSWTSSSIIEGSLAEIFRAMSKWEKINTEINDEIADARAKYNALQEQYLKISEDMKPYQKIINSSANLRIAKLKQAAKEVNDGDSSGT